jgi:predicted RNase H-like HicB family nuclease
MSDKLKQILKVLKLEKPKVSSSAFVFFAKDHRRVMQEDFPGSTFEDISRRLSEAWKLLCEEEREYYEELSLIDKSRFKEEKRVYRREFYSRLARAMHSGLLQPEQLDPSCFPPQKKARAPFVFYSMHVRPMLRVSGESDKSQSIIKPLTVMWNSLNSQQRIPFNQLAQEDLERVREDRLFEHGLP